MRTGAFLCHLIIQGRGGGGGAASQIMPSQKKRERESRVLCAGKKKAQGRDGMIGGEFPRRKETDATKATKAIKPNGN